MKTRNDFVSNSSSCSFIVNVKTKKDVEQLKRLYDDLSSKATIEKSFSFDFDWSIDLVRSVDDIEKDSFIRVNVGEDHDLETIDRFHDVADIVESNEYKFKIYADPYAHCSIGMEWKEN